MVDILAEKCGWGVQGTRDACQGWYYFVLEELELNFLCRVKNWEGRPIPDMRFASRQSHAYVGTNSELWLEKSSPGDRRTQSLCNVQKSKEK